MFPELHAGNGLLLGGDWVGFHKIALDLAARIKESGWSVWELRPYGHSPAGIAAAVYALTVPEPFAMIPLNAALHATAGVTLMRVATFLTEDARGAMWASVPFVIFPSAMTWYSQLEKDGFYFAGAFLCLYGWIQLSRLATWRSSWRPVAAALAWFGAGLILMGLVRVYSFQLIQTIGYLFAIGLAVLFVVRAIKRRISWNRCCAAISLLFAIPLLLTSAPREVRGSAAVQQGQFVDHNWHGDAFSRDEWRRSEWLPVWIENKFLQIAVLREGYLTTPGYKDAGSMIDTDVHLTSATDVVRYLPRAVQIGLLSPFPADWTNAGKSLGGSIMRRIAGLETVLVYCALAFFPSALWRWRFKVEMWLSILYGLVLTVLYAYSTPNLGSLYRQRYGFLMLLVSVGISYAASVWKDLKPRR